MTYNPDQYVNQNPPPVGGPPQPQPGYAPPPPGYVAPVQPPQPQPGYIPPLPAQAYAQPPQPQPGYAPPPPAQAYAQPLQPGYVPPQPLQPGYALPQAQHPVILPVARPVMHVVDDVAMAEAYKRAKDEMAKGGGYNFLKILGPHGQKKWDSSVPDGYEGTALVHVCGPWAPGKPIFICKKKYFWKSRSKPKGTSIIVPPDNDLIGAAFDAAATSLDPVIKTFLEDFGRPRTNYTYNVLLLDNPAAHIAGDGLMHPLVLDEGKQLHTCIGDIFKNADGATNIVNYQTGRPISIIKKKTGPRDMDIVWSAMPAMNPVAVPEDFWPALQNLWDLEKFLKYPTEEEMVAAIIDMGLPLPGPSAQSQVPAAYPGAVAPPYANPHQVTPVTAPPVTPPPALNPPAVLSANPQMPMGPPQVQQQQPVIYPLPSQVGTNLAPPQVQQQGVISPLPSQVGTNPSPPQGGSGLMPPPPVSDVPQLSLPLAAGTVLPEGRERCFGQFNETDNFCVQCPDWVKHQCMPLTGTALNALQSQLQG